MAITTGVARTKNFLLREAKRVERRWLSKVAGGDLGEKLGRGSKGGGTVHESCWVPHPRSGIYCPKGHEWVMNDVPESAARFERAFWLRNVDGVEKLDPDDVPSNQHFPKVL
ncbi:hypothetical protein SLEP1_g35743 [Rubroshorea leprosula]|uniref:Uncharacterized protein n=1 Tax=Rubroshorea leprosula TaxID=152421 RepID=A0AAV5KPD3_9ROSI|nr:hypothetical protein SLEP1_g35743 [Rubroshorea leprosula]